MNKQGPEFNSVFNDVLGPVMRGPSSSHTAGSYRIAVIARNLFGEMPAVAVFTFGEGRSYAQVYQEQGVDCALAAGLMGWDLTDENFFDSLNYAREKGLKVVFKKGSLKDPHPNAVHIGLKSNTGRELKLQAKSIGGGAVKFTDINEWSVEINGKCYVLMVECLKQEQKNILSLFGSASDVTGFKKERGEKSVVFFQKNHAFDEDRVSKLRSNPSITEIWMCPPVFYTKQGKEIFLTAGDILDRARRSKKSLGQLAVEYESNLLGLSPEKVLKKMKERYQVMEGSVEKGLIDENIDMRLLRPSARKIMRSEARGKLLGRGIHLRAAVRAMAVMHMVNSGGIVCAAPTGGSAGVIPGVLLTLHRDLNKNMENIQRSLFAAGAVGLVIARRATFAAEEAGCQVEIGAAGAMAAASVVECAGGNAKQALDAASVSLQNTMGSVCDLVQGMCEIPCHTRNAAAASNAFICADLILGGYKNPISFDETVDASYSVGKMLPSELRCTSKGGIAVAPSAKSLTKIK